MFICNYIIQVRWGTTIVNFEHCNHFSSVTSISLSLPACFCIKGFSRCKYGKTSDITVLFQLFNIVCRVYWQFHLSQLLKNCEGSLHDYHTQIWFNIQFISNNFFKDKIMMGGMFFCYIFPISFLNLVRFCKYIN